MANMRRTVVYHGWRRLAYSWPGIVVVLVLLILMSRSTWRVYAKWTLSRDYAAQARAKYQSNLDRKEEIKSDIERLESAQGWEEEVRKNYQVAKPGEGVIILVDENEKEKENN